MISVGAAAKTCRSAEIRLMLADTGTTAKPASLLTLALRRIAQLHVGLQQRQSRPSRKGSCVKAPQAFGSISVSGQ